MDLRQLLYFTTLAEVLNFRRAAERLNMSQPPLTVAIQKLELELGAPLFTRSARGVALTSAGEAALVSARAALAHADQVRQLAREGFKGERGRLTIGFVSSAIFALLPRLIPIFRLRFPNVELVLEESTSIEIANYIRSRRMDLGFVRLPLIEATHLDVSVMEVDEMVAAVPEAHGFSQRTVLPLRLLASEPFVTYPRGSVLHAQVLMACHEAGFTPRVTQEAAYVPTIMSLIQSGLGVGLVPSIASRHAPDGVKLLRLVRPLRIEMGLVLAGDAAHPLAENFRALAETALQSQGTSLQERP